MANTNYNADIFKKLIENDAIERQKKLVQINEENAKHCNDFMNILNKHISKPKIGTYELITDKNKTYDLYKCPQFDAFRESFNKENPQINLKSYDWKNVNTLQIYVNQQKKQVDFAFYNRCPIYNSIKKKFLF